MAVVDLEVVGRYVGDGVEVGEVGRDDGELDHGMDVKGA
jgi:hypothetical protein